MAQDDSSSAAARWRTAVAVAHDQGDALRASWQRFEREFGWMPWGMLATSLTTGRPNLYLAANEAFCRLTGYSWAELSGRDFLGDLEPDAQATLDLLIQRIMSGDTDHLQADTRLIRKDGETVAVRLTGWAIQPESGDRYLTTYAEDITAASRAVEEVQQLGQELARSRRMESLGHLVGGLAHDFNNLLTVIASYASLVHEEISVAEAADSLTRWGPVRSDVEQIEGAADRARVLIKRMLAFARRERAQVEDVDLAQVISDTSVLLGEMLEEHIPVIVRHGTNMWPVRADSAMLEQVITNIVVNARDAMSDGGQLTISTGNIDTMSMASADLSVGQYDADELAELLPGRYVALRISDTGVGMDPVIAQRAFEPFFTTKGENQSAGLGLTAVQRFAAEAGGKAWLESEAGAGTTVTVVLPAVQGANWEVPGPRGTQDRPAHSGSVLVIDDERQIREVVHRVLSSAGYQVTTAANGQEALAMLAKPGTPADLILTDIVMPGITGGAFAAQVQVLRPGIQLLFMSGYERPDSTASGWPDPDVPVIGKPFSRASLLATVSQLLAATPTKSWGE
jgi:two-component system, cell cycle sensor histidine kinase and response regulator CckA